jgi:hypothetical protein
MEARVLNARMGAVEFSGRAMLKSCAISRARWTAHAAFHDPASAPDARPRESIEIRTLAAAGSAGSCQGSGRNEPHLARAVFAAILGLGPLWGTAERAIRGRRLRGSLPLGHAWRGAVGQQPAYSS